MGIESIGFSVRVPRNISGYRSPQHCYPEDMPTKDNRPSKAVRLALIENAKEYFAGHEINFEKYKGHLEMTASEFLCDVVFVHKKTKAVLRLKAVWFNTKTGEINQAGENYGEIVS